MSVQKNVNVKVDAQINKAEINTKLLKQNELQPITNQKLPTNY